MSVGFKKKCCSQCDVLYYRRYKDNIVYYALFNNMPYVLTLN